MISAAPLSLEEATEQVEGMIHRGEAFACVEDAIDAARFSQHHKAALSLLAKHHCRRQLLSANAAIQSRA